jgi:hypothetical protein
MRNRSISPIATILSVLVLAITAAPTQAGPVAYSEVVHVMSNLRSGGQSQDLRLRSVSQEGNTPVSGGLVASTGKSSTDDPSSASTSEASSLISTSAGPQEGQSGTVEVIQEGDVTGTVCDCGEIILPGGWPKWPLAFIPAAICLVPDLCTKDEEICVTGCCDGNCDETVIPEPTSIFLLGTGLAALGAGARRRYQMHRLSRSLQTDTEA